MNKVAHIVNIARGRATNVTKRFRRAPAPTSSLRSTEEAVLRIHQHNQNKKRGHETAFSFLFQRFSLRDLTFFIKRLAFLINAGVPVVEALHVLQEQVRTKSHAAVLGRIIEDASNGQSLSRSFAKFPKIFSDFAIHIIRVGESSGTLSQNLQYLADELKKRHALRRKVVSALVYPAFITCATLGITAALTVFIFPKILPIFSSLNVELPLSTRMLIWTSVFLSHWGLGLIMGVHA
jgi:type IV pilus assembly protein PilC